MTAKHAPVAPAGSVFAAANDAAGPLLWLADITPARDPVWMARHEGWLTADERARAHRIQRAERRAQLVAGHVLLRRLAAVVSGVPPQDVCVGAEAGGRPTIVAPRGLRASLAHSGQWVAAMVDHGDIDPGFDIERHAPQRDIRAIVWAACAVAADSDADAYLTWAQREAEIKAGAAAPCAWVATWNGHALAVCARAQPAVYQFDLAAARSPAPLPVAWRQRDRLPASALPQ